MAAHRQREDRWSALVEQWVALFNAGDAEEISAMKQFHPDVHDR
jgi:ketosteroid isomerase-like protein